MSRSVCRKRSSIFLMSFENSPMAVGSLLFGLGPAGFMPSRATDGNEGKLRLVPGTLVFGPRKPRVPLKRKSRRVWHAGSVSFNALRFLARRGRNHLPDRKVVAQIAAENAAQRGADGAEQKRHEGPERQISSGLARGVGRLRGILLCLVDHVIDAVLRVLLAHSSLRGHDLRQISAVVIGHAVGTERGQHDAI